jgi:hypothetical protein
MKTIVKFTAFAAVLALFALSCAPEVELTGRDWSEWNSQHNAKLTDNRNDDTKYIPTIDSYGYKTGRNTASPADQSQLPLPGTEGLVDEDRELTLEFPAEADFLKASNDKLLSEMKKFMTIYTYKNPVPGNTALDEQYVLSTKGTDIEYEFVKRVNGSDTGLVTIRLTSLAALPSSQPSTEPTTGAVIKIDGGKYKVNGNGLDVDNDGKAGEAVYDDAYVEIDVTSHNDDYEAPNGNGALQLTIGSVGSGTSPTSFNSGTASRVFQIASISGDFIGDGYPTSAAGSKENERRKTILEGLAPKFKVQKFNEATGKWDDTGAAITYENTLGGSGTGVTTAAYGTLNAALTVEHLSIYRIYASGLKGIKTAGLAELNGGVEKKISITNNNPVASTSEKMGLREDKFISANAGYYNGDTLSVDATSIYDDTVASPLQSVEVYTYDNAGKKATVKILLSPITVSGSKYFVKEEADLFKKYLRIAYVPTSGAPASLTAITDPNVAFLKITDVQFERVNDPGTTDHAFTRVILTIDSNLKVTDNPSFTFLLAPGFEYTSTSIRFGDFTAIDTVIDGIRGWKLYDNITFN